MKRTKFFKEIRTQFPKGKSGIYRIRSKTNDKIYIGSSINLYARKYYGHISPLKKGKHYNCHLQSHFNKYGIDDLIFDVLEFCSKEKLIEREQYWIDTLKPEFNLSLTSHSILGYKHTKESKEKISKGNIGRKVSKDVREKIGVSNIGKQAGEKHHMFGKHHSSKTRAKMSKSKKGKFIGKDNPNYGNTSWAKGLTKETDERIKIHSEMMKGVSTWNKGRCMTEEEKKKRSDAMKLWYTTDAGKEWKIKNSERYKGVKKSESACQNISEGVREYWCSEEGLLECKNRKGKRGPPSKLKGKKLPKEWVEKRVGKKRSEETKQKMRDSAKRNWESKTEEDLLNISEAQKKSWEKRKTKLYERWLK